MTAIKSKYWKRESLLKDVMCTDDFRVPLLVKMPHQKVPITYTGKFRMFHIHDMLDNIFDGTIQTSEDLTAWMKLQEPRFTLEGLSRHETEYAN